MRTLLPDNDPNDWVQFLKPKPCYFESWSLTNKVTSKQMQMWLLWSEFARYFPLFAVLHSAAHTSELQWPINCFFIGTHLMKIWHLVTVMVNVSISPNFFISLIIISPSFYNEKKMHFEKRVSFFFVMSVFWKTLCSKIDKISCYKYISCFNISILKRYLFF